MKKEKFFGIAFILFSLTTLLTNLNLTGAVVGISKNNLNFISLIFLIFGITLFLHGNNLEDLTRKIKQASPAEIRRIANKRVIKKAEK